MAAVYSTRFIASPAPEFPPTYTVPAGFIAVVRCIDLWCPAGYGGSRTLVQMVSPACIIFEAIFGAGEESAHWDGRQVLEPGEQLTLNSDVPSPGSALVSGYLLTLP
jgi:hypothetical protein